ncbi:hypothetical protein [Parachitinimonas caeni]|uniref:Uncharacterized protein n=1 Tax=Parachitinimonas caeni TaxID=3031301 RepID=A0ABT7E1I9_9NEIS|nr:hypothetical protein [Parachitinimonas caeni]MDK2126184.1 hypothetical protein [Parachitinimonas caeni]
MGELLSGTLIAGFSWYRSALHAGLVSFRLLILLAALHWCFGRASSLRLLQGLWFAISWLKVFHVPVETLVVRLMLVMQYTFEVRQGNNPSSQLDRLTDKATWGQTESNYVLELCPIKLADCFLAGMWVMFIVGGVVWVG